jgi:type III pantothenate kinase
VLTFHTEEFAANRLGETLPPEPCTWRVASVQRATAQELGEWVAKQRTHDRWQLLSFRDLRLKLDVQFPDRVGMDRLAAAVAVNRLRAPTHAAIIVDAGTAITVDAVDRQGTFLGGAILPGFGMISRALFADTDLLPRVDATFTAPANEVIGRSTESAIRSGIFWGGVGAIRELVERFAERLGPAHQLFVTGGDARLLTGFLDPQAQFVPELVLDGIIWSDS